MLTRTAAPAAIAVQRHDDVYFMCCMVGFTVVSLLNVLSMFECVAAQREAICFRLD